MLGTERLTDQECVQTDRHNARIACAFFIQHVELIDDHVPELLAAEADIHKHRNVVQLDSIRHRNQVTLFNIKLERLIVGSKIAQYSTSNSASISGVLKVSHKNGPRPTFGLATQGFSHLIQRRFNDLWILPWLLTDTRFAGQTFEIVDHFGFHHHVTVLAVDIEKIGFVRIIVTIPDAIAHNNGTETVL